ncbi:Arf GTPase activating protein [Penicillium citrinum]|uniref:Arf GTPase activating protein n=1 Tax=Penicillium citrinum TaxID=5077 RepID=A0A9W9PBC7_PENCI|nr:Arf GTPase activating protein [Penicillium citrinum]KAJ5241398.1 Arf GTPase activating protein [Penicillium citrinum]
MSRMWEVDPETRTKLLQISKTNGNDRCCDCGAPSPQWASPKFGTFICLNCAGTHRGLGVHISFVRSITMDAFKHAEIQRMEQGGNEPWKTFYDAHPVTTSEGRTFEDSTIKERYEGDAGEEWKERLSCKVEGREYVQGQEKKNNASSRSSTPMSGSGAGAGVGGASAGAGAGARTGSPATSIRSDSIRGGATSKKEQNEAYFAKLGNDNATRSDALPPSKGGKFTGFGGGMPPPSAGDRRSSPFGGFGGWGAFGGGGGAPGLDEFQKDPMASLTKGLGWFASTVGKGAKTVNDSYLQPTAKQLAESDFAAQARVQATNWGQNFQSGARNAADQFNRFVEGDDGGHGSRSRVEPERRDFWDDFSSIGAQQQQQQEMSGHQRSGSRSGVIGTAAMRKGPAPAASSLSNETTAPSGVEAGDAPTKSKSKEKDDWDDNW